MRLLYAGLGVFFSIFAVIELSHASPGLHCYAYSTTYALAALVSLLALKRSYGNRPMLPFLALLAVIVMVVQFAVFFTLTGDESAQHPSVIVSSDMDSHLLPTVIAGFLMLPVVAHFSCRMKAGSCQAYFRKQPKTSVRLSHSEVS